MKPKGLVASFICGVLLSHPCLPAMAQDTRTQYPRILSNSYVGLNVGYIRYPFRDTPMAPGFDVQTIRVPHLAVRALLLGHDFNRFLSAEVSYMRPIQWVQYENVNGDRISRSVWTNVAGLTAKPHLAVTKTLSVYAEGGLGIVTRKGFEIDGKPTINDANYATVLLGVGLQYRITDKWELVAGSNWAPAYARANMPTTSLYSAGFSYSMRPLSAEQVERNSNTGLIFPKQLIQAGYSTNALGYSANDFVSKGIIPVFWAADVDVASGLSINYQRNVFHTRRIFSLDWGTGASIWKSQKKGNLFATTSFYPVFRFTVVRTRPMDFYFNYSLAGPTLISRTSIDNEDTGRRFTFQDFMGMGTFIGRKRRANAEIRISHYSNGNLFPRNAGVTVPISFNVGRSF
jgi:opacity protein-like surface antigen